MPRMAEALAGKNVVFAGELRLFGLVDTVGLGCYLESVQDWREVREGPRRFQTGRKMPDAAGRLSREAVPLEFLVGLHRHPVTLLIFGMTGVAGNVGKSDRVG